MKNHIEWRPHHGLCRHSYVGIAYNSEQTKHWNRIFNSLEKYPEMRVKIVLAEDVLCKSCPNSKNNFQKCNQSVIKKLDIAVMKLLGIKEGNIYRFKDIEHKLHDKMTYQKHKNLCENCGWWSMWGICENAFKKK
jgi:hypothetical protein